MTPVDEAEEAALFFQAAFVRMGVSTIAEALVLWQRVNPMKVAATAAGWLEDAIQMILSRRGQSRELAIAYYRLVRALRTGTTLVDPRDPEPTYVTMRQLREEFAALVNETLPVADDHPSPPATEGGEREKKTTTDPTVKRYTPSQTDADREIQLEALREIAELERDLAKREAEAAEEARVVLEALGTENLKRAATLKGLDELSALEADEAREKAHAQAAARQAAAAERLVLNAARGALLQYAESDRRAVGFIRLSRSGTPCGWCAMLISRGVAYFKRASAELTADGDKYHDNCHCYAEPIFSRADYRASDLYALNRQYGVEWPKVTKGKSGKAAVAAWRRHIRIQQREARSQARAPETAQEASR